MALGLSSRDAGARGGGAPTEAMVMAHVEFPEVLVQAYQILQLFFHGQPRGRHPGISKHRVGLTNPHCRFRSEPGDHSARSPFKGFILQALLPTARLPTSSPSGKPHSHPPHQATPSPRPRVTPGLPQLPLSLALCDLRVLDRNLLCVFHQLVVPGKGKKTLSYSL